MGFLDSLRGTIKNLGKTRERNADMVMGIKRIAEGKKVGNVKKIVSGRRIGEKSS